jgi:hypothetical protein
MFVDPHYVSCIVLAFWLLDFWKMCFVLRGWPGSVVGITTGYGLDTPGIESPWGRNFPHLSRPALGPT